MGEIGNHCNTICGLLTSNTIISGIVFFSVISWRSVLLVEETTDLSQVTAKLDHIMLYLDMNRV
jgi:hypothetical protein